MRVAALYDIHGNIDALDAVLAEVTNQAVHHIVIGGDIEWGPFPVETVAGIRSLGDHANVIRGNADREVAARANESAGLQDWVAEVNAWCADRLDTGDRQFLATLPETTTVAIQGLGDVLFCHGTPRSDDEIITPLTPDEDVAAVLREVSQHLVVCGHTFAIRSACGRYPISGYGHREFREATAVIGAHRHRAPARSYKVGLCGRRNGAAIFKCTG